MPPNHIAKQAHAARWGKWPSGVARLRVHPDGGKEPCARERDDKSVNGDNPTMAAAEDASNTCVSPRAAESS